MIPLIVVMVLIAIVVPVWLCWRYEPPPRLTVPVCVRYLLLCLLVFLMGLLALRDPLLIQWAPVILCASVAFSVALVVLLAGELCLN